MDRHGLVGRAVGVGLEIIGIRPEKIAVLHDVPGLKAAGFGAAPGTVARMPREAKATKIVVNRLMNTTEVSSVWARRPTLPVRCARAASCRSEAMRSIKRTS